jgi:hypothetical protein
MRAHPHHRQRTPRNGLRGLIIWVAMCLSACGGGSDPGSATSAAAFSIEVTPAQAIAFADSGRVLTVTLARTGGSRGRDRGAEQSTGRRVGGVGDLHGDTVSLPLSLRLMPLWQRAA